MIIIPFDVISLSYNDRLESSSSNPEFFSPRRQGDAVLPAAVGGGAHLIDGHVRVIGTPRKCSSYGVTILGRREANTFT